jgi:hypothetical protein
MKKLILSSIVVLFMNSTVANGIGPDHFVKFSNVDKEIAQLLNSYPQLAGLEQDVRVRVSIQLNDNYEIEVLRVIPENESVERFIKSKLEKKKLASRELKVATEYSFPVIFRVN